ncbi:hypothetical protein PLICBS_006566 [Purpureocillium lilacinum]|uniref:uncharacterized protein n=1 Tax=Purpureocillium lilacinum TaxID=33203 RepID=UPI00207EA63A|nr:hypothetical protein PLICBS_006566 [Purpureocillium lilacinum]
MKELTEIRDEIDHQRRTIRYVIEEDEQKKTISQHRADLEVLQKTHGNILARKQHISQSVDASPQFEDVSVRQAEVDDAWCVETAKGDWERMKALEGAQSTPLDTLMSMIGLEDVKKEFIAIKTKVDTSLRQGVSLTSERFSCTLLEVENNRGKIVFVLAGYSRQMEGFFSHNPGIPSRFPIEIRFADYTDDELLSIFNKTIHQRFGGRMTCEDGHRGLYCRIVARRIGYGRGRDGFGNARAVENIVDIVHKRQGSRLRRERSSGEHPNDFIFTKEDLIGPAPNEVLANCKAWEKLQGLLGLQAVKEAVQSLMDSIRENHQRELEEKPRIDFSLNKVFVGSPGTGKTTVAKLYGEILAALGLLSKGEVVVRNPADFIGSALGQSEQQTKGILAATVGKVLVIDEAYGLYGGSQGGTTDPYKTAVIDTIVAEVQSVPGDDRCVLLLGYRDQLETMFQSVNPGLSRRFPLAMAFTFDDFSSEELGQILDMKLKDQGYRITGQARSVAMDILRRARNRPNFGNAGEVDIILSEAKRRSQARRSTTQSGSVDLLEAVDFDEDFDRVEQSETNIRKLFGSTIGCGALVDRLIGYQSTAKSVKALGLDPKNSIPFNFLFRGPPGTGKTTTARKMGKVFYDMGFLATAEVHECSATELVGQYVGQTGPKVQQVLDRALGRVLFVDEAYRLGDGTFSREAVDELVTCLTKDRYHKKLIVILAGYDDEVNRLMAINPGLSSRFPEAVDFRALSAAECIQLLQVALSRQQDQLKKNGVKLELAVLTRPTVEYVSKMMNHFSRLISQESWANARDVMTLAEGIFNRVVKWNTGTNMHSLVLKEAMVTDELCAMHEERQSRASSTRGPELIRPETMLVGQSPITYNRSQLTSTSSFAAAMRPHKEEEHLENSTSIYENHPVTSGGSMTRALHAETRDKGVSDAVWDQLERDKAAEAAKEERFQRLQSAARDARDAARDLILKK